MSDFQLPSWFDPRGFYKGKQLLYPEGWLVSQIFFPTNKSALDPTDEKVLDMLFSVYSKVQVPKSKRQWFRFYGYADWRGTEKNNLQLGIQRARATMKSLDFRFRLSDTYASEAKSRGEKYATKTGIIEEMAGDRRVDVFAPLRVKTRIVMSPQFITAKAVGVSLPAQIFVIEDWEFVSLESRSPPKRTCTVIVEKFTKFKKTDTVAYKKSVFDKKTHKDSGTLGPATYVHRWKIGWRKRTTKDTVRSTGQLALDILNQARGTPSFGNPIANPDAIPQLKGNKFYKSWKNFLQKDRKSYNEFKKYIK